MNAMRGTLVLVRLAPDRLRLRLDSGHATENGDRPVEHAQRALDLGGEIDMAWGVDDIDALLDPGEQLGDRVLFELAPLTS